MTRARGPQGTPISKKEEDKSHSPWGRARSKPVKVTGVGANARGGLLPVSPPGTRHPSSKRSCKPASYGKEGKGTREQIRKHVKVEPGGRDKALCQTR